jgi:hypothetical protein
LTVSGRPEGIRGGLPFLGLFAPDLNRLHILHVHRVPGWRYRVLTHEVVQRLSQHGLEYCHRIESEILQQLGLESDRIDLRPTGSMRIQSSPTISWAILYAKPMQRILGTGPVTWHIYALAWLGIPLIYLIDLARKRVITCRSSLRP